MAAGEPIEQLVLSTHILIITRNTAIHNTLNQNELFMSGSLRMVVAVSSY